MFGHHHAPEEIADPAEFRQNNLESMLAVIEGTLEPPTTLVMQAGERAVFELSGAPLVEAHRAPAGWVGRSSGVSVPVGHHGVRVRVGQSHGTFVEGSEAPTAVDTGIVTLTTTRAVFRGATHAHEWPWAKLLSVVYDTKGCWAAIEVSGSERVSGFGYGTMPAELIAGWCDTAVSLSRDEGDEAAADLREQLASDPS